VISRSFNHIGPGQAPTFVVPSLAHRIVEAKRTGGTALKVGNLSPRRDFTDVRDVARAYRLLAEKGVPGEVYNVSNGVDVSIEELAHRMLELSGVDLELTVDPELVRPVEVPVLRGDATKLRAATGWAPQVELDDTLRDVLGAIERA
jgi:GDP-4-dehydro-6-deoxy-D-mannose reductase